MAKPSKHIIEKMLKYKTRLFVDSETEFKINFSHYKS